MTASVLVYALLTGACGLAQSPSQLAILRFLAATGMGGEWALGVALVMESWPSEYRPLLAGLVGAVGNLGYTAVAGLALILPPTISWRGLLWICTAPAAMTFFIRLFVPESERWRHAAASGKARVGDLFAPGIRSRAFLAAAIGAVPLFATWGAVQFTQLWAQQLGGNAAGSYVQICSAAMASLGAFLAPIVLFRVRRRWGYAFLCLAAFVSAEYLFLAHVDLGGGFYGAVGMTGLLSATFYGWLPLYLPELFPDTSARGRAGILLQRRPIARRRRRARHDILRRCAGPLLANQRSGVSGLPRRRRPGDVHPGNPRAISTGIIGWVSGWWHALRLCEGRTLRLPRPSQSLRACHQCRSRNSARLRIGVSIRPSMRGANTADSGRTSESRLGLRSAIRSSSASAHHVGTSASRSPPIKRVGWRISGSCGRRSSWLSMSAAPRGCAAGNLVAVLDQEVPHLRFAELFKDGSLGRRV